MPAPATRGLGVPGDLPADAVRALAEAAEAAGYQTFWTNDTPDGDGLAALQAAADVTETLRLGVGIVPVDRVPPQLVGSRIAERGLPVDRLVVGIGAGAAPGGLRRVRDTVPILRRRFEGPIVIGALGPRMAQLAGTVADGVLLDWQSPRSAAAIVDHVRRGAHDAGRTAPPVMGYVFTALGGHGRRELQVEIAHYASVASYAAHFRRAGIDPADACVDARTVVQLRRRLAAFDSVLDETVVRAVADGVAARLQVLHAAAPGPTERP
jgi:alkanesulfonate monooxygenase SsuD/methylene tetrahydromethanopterin reductase-like flavin-dependent oxidoreductase (luciferase family)